MTQYKNLYIGITLLHLFVCYIIYMSIRLHCIHVNCLFYKFSNPYLSLERPFCMKFMHCNSYVLSNFNGRFQLIFMCSNLIWCFYDLLLAIVYTYNMYRVMSGSYFQSTNQRKAYKITQRELLSNWWKYLSALHVIGQSKMNDRLPDMTPHRMLLDMFNVCIWKMSKL